MHSTSVVMLVLPNSFIQLSCDRNGEKELHWNNIFFRNDFLAFCLLQVKNRTSKPKKKVPVQKISSNSEFVDDDDALKQVTFSGLSFRWDKNKPCGTNGESISVGYLMIGWQEVNWLVSVYMQAIALSLKDCPVATDRLQSGPSQSSDAGVLDDTKSERKGKAQIQEGSGRRKRKKPVCFRLGLVFILCWNGFFLMFSILLFCLIFYVVDRSLVECKWLKMN